ncbi:MAG: GNVR domain-containing protein [Treponema sp.]
MSESQDALNSASQKDDEISLIDLLSVLLHYKKMIILTTLSVILITLILCIISLLLPSEKSFLPNEYTPEATMLINDSSSSQSSLSSALSSSGLGSLASLAGVNVPLGSSYSSLAGYLIQSTIIQDKVIDEYNLIERYKIKEYPYTSARKQLSKKLVSSFDEETGVFKINFTDIDPVFAQQVINFTVDLLEQQFSKMGVDKNKLTKENLEENIQKSYQEILKLQKDIQKIEQSVINVYSASGTQSIMMDATLTKMELQVQEQIYAQLKAQYESLKITMASEQPVFQILNYAEVPEKKSGPSRGKIMIIVSFAAFFIAIFIAFLLNAIKNIKNDPEAMKKLKTKK